MAPSDASSAPIGPLGEDDLDDALALSAEAGWNQVAADWRLMLRVGHGLAVRDGGRVVATALALPYPPAFGWVSMVLVHAPYRRRGLATRLVEHASALLEGRGLVPALDATPAGAEVYARMGFRPVLDLVRLRGAGRGAADAPPRAIAVPAALDAAAFGAPRDAVLDDLAGRPSPAAAATPDGYLLARSGRTATQLGPLVARGDATAVALLDGGLGAVAGPVVIDVPAAARAVAGRLAGAGLAPERPFVRMVRGSRDLPGDPSLVHAIAGPELG